jgi:zinc D-Ala-D-Ala carboxypeptidase
MTTHAPDQVSLSQPVPPTRGRGVRPAARSRRALAAALVLGLALLAGPISAPSAVRALGPLPECRLADIMTVPRGYDDWSVTLVDWLLRVEEDYVPPDLVHVSEAGIAGGGFIRAVAMDDLRAMAEAAAANGTPIGVWSPYRSYEEQVEIFNGYANGYGFDNAITYSHRPGHSEHQLGLGVDFMSAGGSNPLIGDWATTPAGAWMAENAWRFGWVMSYPIEPAQVGTDNLWSDRICFTYEPWHYRYLGREIAAAIHESGLTIREYLWANYTMVDPVTGSPLPTPTPTPEPTPEPTPTPTASPTPEPTATPTAVPTPEPTPSPDTRLLGLDPPVAAVLLGGLLLAVLAAVALSVRRGTSRR